ncbi:hypothetical protein LS71_008310 [Helicobacter jaachi]|uniref:Uncharacterized protein n=1 Tax=Helicobacter jaachi TaxID=1677920 RepID=A0A4U8T6Z2_9HELI|nr:hypothetical protein [Helicobacter jaachi]TLD95400.1 hypothetical protein LS71_008310 [Helicobacter jaachi]
MIVKIAFCSKYDEILYVLHEQEENAKQIAELIMESEIAFEYAMIYYPLGIHYVRGNFRECGGSFD